MPELPNLDLLRSVAVLLVVFGHGTMYLQRGHSGFLGITGVCMFFVHTTLVLMGSLERDPHVGRFYLRRAFRIYPLWLLVLGATVVFAIPTSPAAAPAFAFVRPDWRDLLGNATLTMNVYGYPDLVGASWSLPLEMQMYLFLPFLFAAVRLFKGLWPLLVMQGFVMFYAWRTIPPGVMSLVLCVPYFLPGVMAYVLYQRRRVQRLPEWMFAAFLLVTVGAMGVWGTFQRGWFFSLVLGLALPWFRQIRSARWNRLWAMIARYSYGVYLTHIPAIYVGLSLLRGEPLAVRGGGVRRAAGGDAGGAVSPGGAAVYSLGIEAGGEDRARARAGCGRAHDADRAGAISEVFATIYKSCAGALLAARQHGNEPTRVWHGQRMAMEKQIPLRTTSQEDRASDSCDRQGHGCDKQGASAATGRVTKNARRAPQGDRLRAARDQAGVGVVQGAHRP